MKKFISLLKKKSACEDGLTFALSHATAKAAWDACKNPEWMLWALNEFGLDDDKKNRLFACWCARNTPIGDGKTTWDLLTDDRSRNAVVVAERFAIGEATNEELAAARNAAWNAAGNAARAATWNAARAATWDAARNAAWNAAGNAAMAATWNAARDAARAAQAKALRDIYGFPFAEILKGKRGKS